METQDSLPRSRIPLLQRIQSPSNVPAKPIRRKNSFVLHADSSEDTPSPHPSIFEAVCTSPNSSDEFYNRVEPAHNHRSIENTNRVAQLKDENRPDSIILPTTIYAQFRYGNGTVLNTITEQKSCGTIRSVARTKSYDDMPHLPFLRHQDSFVLGKLPRRMQSFSLDDLALIKSFYHDACASIERETFKPLCIPEIYAQPKTPIQAPLDRPPTPDGIPSWTAAQNTPRPTRTRNLPSSSSYLQRLFGFTPSKIKHSSRVTTASIQTSHTASTPVSVRLAPIFRPPRSTYSPIDQHPFYSAPVSSPNNVGSTFVPGMVSGQSKIKRRLGLKVRFTASATARDSEMAALQSAIEASTASAIHPFTTIRMSGVQRPNGAEKQRQCTHRKGGLTISKSLRNSQSVNAITSLNNSYSVPYTSPTLSEGSSTIEHHNLARSSSRPGSIRSTRSDDLGILDTLSPRTLSLSSTAYLMSGAVADPSISPRPAASRPAISIPAELNQVLPAPKPISCWKCSLRVILEKLNRLWDRSAGTLCLICCGFDVNEYSSDAANACRGANISYQHDDPRYNPTDNLGPRMAIVNTANIYSV